MEVVFGKLMVNTEPPTSNIQPPTSNIQPPTSSLEKPGQSYLRANAEGRRQNAECRMKNVSGGGNVDENRQFENPVPLTHSAKIDPWLRPKG